MWIYGLGLSYYKAIPLSLYRTSEYLRHISIEQLCRPVTVAKFSVLVVDGDLEGRINGRTETCRAAVLLVGEYELLAFQNGDQEKYSCTKYRLE